MLSLSFSLVIRSAQLPNGATKRSATSNDDDEQIGQYVKSLMVAEERKKAAESGTKVVRVSL